MVIEREAWHGIFDEGKELLVTAADESPSTEFRRRGAVGAAVARLDALERLIHGRRGFREHERRTGEGAHAFSEGPSVFETSCRVHSVARVVAPAALGRNGIFGMLWYGGRQACACGDAALDYRGQCSNWLYFTPSSK